MKNVWLIFGIGVGLIFMTGCSKMLVLHSDWGRISGTQCGLEDTKNQIMWTVSNDNENLYVQIKTSNFKIIQMIRRNGLTLYVDTLAKKHKGCSLLVRNKQDDSFLMRKNIHENRKPEEQLMMHNFDEAYWEKGGEKMFMDLRYEKTDFLATYSDSRGDGFCCLFIFPINFFDYQKQIKAHQPISVGINLKSAETIGLPVKNMRNEDMPGGSVPNNMGPEGGMPGGRMSGNMGMKNGMRGGGMPGGHQVDKSSSDLDVWVKVFLSEGNK